MRRREVGQAAACAFAGVLLAYLLRALLGSWPNTTVVAGLALTVLGAVLVVSRFSRLGPFHGELGSPWAECELRDVLLSEASRAARYERPLSVVAVRAAGQTAGWETTVRSVDRVVTCRGDWTVLLLPETDAQGSMRLVQRFMAADAAARAAVVSLPDDLQSGSELVAALCDMVTQQTPPGNVVTVRHGQIRAQQLAV